jgi:hypothetical protein
MHVWELQTRFTVRVVAKLATFPRQFVATAAERWDHSMAKPGRLPWRHRLPQIDQELFTSIRLTTTAGSASVPA